MTFLPIVDRELRVAARLTATYRNRALTAGAVAAVAVMMLMFDSLSLQSSRMGAAMFSVLAYLTLCFCLLEGVRKTADCLSEEKREGTLGLLFLTDLKGYDIIFGKLAGMSLNSIYGLISILPVLALPLLVGGVVAGEYWRLVLALLNILFFSLSVGICVSAVSRREQSAMAGTLLVTLAFAFLPLVVPLNSLHPFSPLYGFHTAFEAYYLADKQGYWQSLGLTQLWSWLLLIGSSWMVPRAWQQQEGRANVESWYQRDWFRPRREAAEKRARMRAQLLEINPIQWLASRERSGILELRVLAGIVVVGFVIFVAAGNPDFLPIFIGGACILNLLLKMRIAAQACHCLAEARRNNALEMLLVTPLTASQIISGQIQALRRTFVRPGLAILILEFAGFTYGLIIASSASGTRGNFSSFASFLVVGYLAVFALDVVAVTWAGMWFGLTAKKESQALTKTILLVLILPLCGFILSCFGLVFYILVPFFWISWARGRLETRMRELAGQRYSLPPVSWQFPTPPRGPMASKPPPVIG